MPKAAVSLADQIRAAERAVKSLSVAPAAFRLDPAGLGARALLLGQGGKPGLGHDPRFGLLDPALRSSAVRITRPIGA